MAEGAPYPTLVVAAFNRPDALRRLLHSIARADYPPEEIPLLISIDQGHVPEVAAVAREFEWNHGPKKVLEHVHHLGLREHLLACGDHCLDAGPVIVLEDDLYVSPQFYRFACEGLAFYRRDPKLAGLSLYHYAHAESCGLPFQPVDDGSDVYFMQWPSSWGQLWWPEAWQPFREWLRIHSEPDQWLPEYVRQWEPDSWKRLMVAWMRATDRYMAYPRWGLSTHFGAPGKHSVVPDAQQSPLTTAPREWRWTSLQESKSVYDAWFELLPDLLGVHFSEMASELTVDLYGQKEEKTWKKWLLTSRPPLSGRFPQKSFALQLLPLPLNVVQDLPGQQLHLGRAGIFSPEKIRPGRLLPQLPGWSRHFWGRPGLSQEPAGISIVTVLPDRHNNWEKTVASVQLQQDQVSDWVVVTRQAGTAPDGATEVLWPEGESYFTALEIGLKASQGPNLFWLHPGAELPPGLLEKATDILGKYPGIDWLLLRGEGMSLPQQRWTRDRLGRSRPEVVRNSLGPGLHLWRRSLWRKFTTPLDHEYQLWQQLAQHALPFTADLRGADGPTKGIPWLEHPPEGWKELRANRSLAGLALSRLLRPAFWNDGWLRWAHSEIEHYPPVIRWDADRQCWEMQRF